MAVILTGGCIRMALMDRRSELIRCASITKDATFDEKIKELDDALMQEGLLKKDKRAGSIITIGESDIVAKIKRQKPIIKVMAITGEELGTNVPEKPRIIAAITTK